MMLAALQCDGPTVFLEPKLLSESWLEFLGSGGWKTVQCDVPVEGARGEVPQKWTSLPIGRSVLRRTGKDVSIVSVGVGVHRAGEVAKEGISADVLDVRTIAPLDVANLCETDGKTGRVVVVDEDYEGFGLSGEVAAVLAGKACSRLSWIHSNIPTLLSLAGCPATHITRSPHERPGLMI